jgi:hypothetical protein
MYLTVTLTATIDQIQTTTNATVGLPLWTLASHSLVLKTALGRVTLVEASSTNYLQAL